METIINYLDAMFANLPNTESVQRAKSELLQMMEDKYNELISEGASENSAVGTVISEFGNLDELAEDLGLKNEIDIKDIADKSALARTISLEEAKEFLDAESKSGLMIGIGVLLCILSATGVMISEVLKINESIGISLMFGMIAIAVGMFVYNGVISSKWKFIKDTFCQIDMTTASYLTNEKSRYSSTHALRLTIGIVLCVICWLPAVVFDGFRLDELGGILLFVLVGIGVFMIVFTSTINNSFDKLLAINESDTMKGKYIKDNNVEYINDKVKLFMELYWPVITAVYLSWSFLSFEWWKTWIIWPIAAITHAILKKLLEKK